VRWQPASNDVGPEEEDIVGTGCQATTSEDTEDLVGGVVNCRVCEFVKAPTLFVVTIYKCPINPNTNPNTVSSH
jgi:hypothetical protein